MIIKYNNIYFKVYEDDGHMFWCEKLTSKLIKSRAVIYNQYTIPKDQARVLTDDEVSEIINS